MKDRGSRIAGIRASSGWAIRRRPAALRTAVGRGPQVVSTKAAVAVADAPAAADRRGKAGEREEGEEGRGQPDREHQLDPAQPWPVRGRTAEPPTARGPTARVVDARGADGPPIPAIRLPAPGLPSRGLAEEDRRAAAAGLAMDEGSLRVGVGGPSISKVVFAPITPRPEHGTGETEQEREHRQRVPEDVAESSHGGPSYHRRRARFIRESELEGAATIRTLRFPPPSPSGSPAPHLPSSPSPLRRPRRTPTRARALAGDRPRVERRSSVIGASAPLRLHRSPGRRRSNGGVCHHCSSRCNLAPLLDVAGGTSGLEAWAAVLPGSRVFEVGRAHARVRSRRPCGSRRCCGSWTQPQGLSPKRPRKRTPLSLRGRL
jgi:hypothetical protein